MTISANTRKFTVPLTGFSAPDYFNDDITNDTGWDISSCSAYVCTFEGTGVSTVVHEQTLDPAGLTGWFPVYSRLVAQAGSSMAAGGSASGSAYLIGQFGVRARVRVTALTTGDATMRLAFITQLGDVSASLSQITVFGGANEDGVQFGNPTSIAVEARNTNKNPMSTNGDVVRPTATMIGVQVTRPYSIPELEWQSTGTKIDTTDLVVKAAAGAGLKNYMTGLQYQNNSAVASLIVIKQGSTEIWRGNAPANMGVPAIIPFKTPLQTVANAAFNVALLTTGTSTAINAQGYIAP